MAAHQLAQSTRMPHDRLLYETMMITWVLLRGMQQQTHAGRHTRDACEALLSRNDALNWHRGVEPRSHA
jgi:hypothetical protein